MKEFITENLGTIVTIIGVISASFGVIIASVKKAKKEIMDVVNAYKAAMADGKIEEAEAEVLIKELEEAITAATKTFYLIAGVFKKAKKKKAK